MGNAGVTGYLLVFGVVVICSCCSVRRGSVVSDYKGDAVRWEMERMEARERIRLSASSSVSELWGNVRIVRREFDLDREPDGEGRYPVKSETSVEGDGHGRTETETGEKEESASRDSVKVDADIDSVSVLEKTSDVDARAGVDPLWWWLVGAVTVVVGLIIIYIRYGKKDKAG